MFHQWWRQCRLQPALAQHQKQRALLQQAHIFNQTIVVHSYKLTASSEQVPCTATACTLNQITVMHTTSMCLPKFSETIIAYSLCRCMTKASKWIPCKHSTAQHSTAQHSTAQRSAAQRSTDPHSFEVGAVTATDLQI